MITIRFNIFLVLICISFCNSFAYADDDHAVIFMYHHFGDDRFPSTNVSIDQFKDHLDYLEQHNYTVWPLSKVIQYLQQKKPLPARTVSVTMDDAYVSVYHQAFPLMQERKWPFTVFVSTDYIDRGYENYMSWDQMRTLSDAGVEFANHSSSHRHLVLPGPGTTDWKTQNRQDITNAQQRLKSELGDDIPKLFSYPYGEYTQALAELLNDLGFVGIGQQSGAVGFDTDFRAVPRYPMAGAYADMESFIQKIHTMPLPLLTVKPWEPLTDNLRPELSITLDLQHINPEQIRCYISGQGLTEITWLNPEKSRMSIRPERAFNTGRQRVNCTAPSPKKGYYYWYSHPWIVLPAGATLTN